MVLQADFLSTSVGPISSINTKKSTTNSRSLVRYATGFQFKMRTFPLYRDLTFEQKKVLFVPSILLNSPNNEPLNVRIRFCCAFDGKHFILCVRAVCVLCVRVGVKLLFPFFFILLPSNRSCTYCRGSTSNAHQLLCK